MAFKSLAEKQQLSNAIVVDNSVMMRWLFQDGSESDQQIARQVLGQIETHKPQMIVPYIWVYEASFVVNYYAKKEGISYETCMNHLDALFDLCTVIRGEETPSKLFSFANIHGLSSYDAAYLQLAVQQCCPIATLDKAMMAVAEQLNVSLIN